MKYLLYKTISWRLVSTVPFAALTFLVTGSFAMSSSLVIMDVVGRTILYALHEWVWDHPPARLLLFKDRIFRHA